MEQKVHPSNANGNTAPAAAKTQLYNLNRPPYRPQPSKRRHRRGCCCRCCCWTIFFVIVIVMLAAIAAAIFYALYRPQRPTFTVNSLQVSRLNITSPSNKLTSRLNITLSARNPNSDVIYTYHNVSLSVLTTVADVQIAQGSLPGFLNGKKNTTLLKTEIGNSGHGLDDVSADAVRKSLKSKSGSPLRVILDTKVKARIGKLKTPRIRLRVSCDGIRVKEAGGKIASAALISDHKCKVDVRVKVWKWTF